MRVASVFGSLGVGTEGSFPFGSGEGGRDHGGRLYLLVGRTGGWWLYRGLEDGGIAVFGWGHGAFEGQGLR